MRHRRLAAAAAAGVILVAGGSVAYAQTQDSAGSYRTTAVSVGDVDETLALSGTITASTRQDLSFGASGTVRKVAVKAGEVVRSGKVLATLDPTDLTTAVTKAKATLAKARAQLETDQASQASTVTDSKTPTTTTPTKTTTPKTTTPKKTTPKKTTPTTTPKSDGTSPALQAALKKLSAQQTAVTTAQTAATEAITAAKAALATQVAACKDADAQAPVDAQDSDDDDPQTTPATGISDKCSAALEDVQAAQDVVAQKQDALQTALQALSATLTEAVKAVGDSSTPSTTPTATPTTPADESSDSADSAAPAASAGSGSSTSGGTGGAGGGATVTAATLAKDQAAIDTAKAELTEAGRALKSARLTAPFAGEVLSVSAAKGDEVADSDVVIVLAGDGATTVTTTVTLDQVADVEVGQTAAVTPAGAAKPVTGTVTSIGLLPDTSTDTATYPVTLDLDGEVAAPEGSTASIQLVVGTAKDVLTVPSSAVSTGRGTTVSVLTDGQPVVTRVTVGVVGATRTAITDGVTKGQQVVLADLDAALPSGDSTTTRLPGSGGGGFSGGMPGGGGGQRGARG